MMTDIEFTKEFYDKLDTSVNEWDYPEVLHMTTHEVKEAVNPKEAHGRAKPDLGLCPKAGLEAQAAAHSLGAKKYGAYNWRDSRIKASTYTSAIMRHLQEWKEVEDNDKETGASHLGNIMACCAILLDSQQYGTLVDDRYFITNVKET